MRCEKNCGYSYCVIKSGDMTDGIISAAGYGIAVCENQTQPEIINDIADDYEYVLNIAEYLNKNDVAPEHMHQVLEEILCRWPCV